MRFLSVLAVGLIVTAAATAQNQTFEIYSGSTSYTSRGNLGTGSGESLMGLHTSHWRGLGDNGSTCEVTQMGLVDQDQNSNTQESFHLVIRTGTDANGPGTGIVDRIARFGPLLMPSTPTGSINAWIQTITLTTAATIPCAAHVSWGAEMTASTNWAADGMSTHTTFSRTNRNMQFCHMNSEAHGYYFPTGQATADRDTANARSWRYRLGLSTDRNVLQLGATGNSLGGGTGQRYGMSGMFPATGETLSGRVTQTASGDTVWSYLDAGYGAGLAISAGTRVWLAGIALTQVGASTATGATTTHIYGATSGSIPIALPFQFAVIRSGVLSVSNANATSILP